MPSCCTSNRDTGRFFGWLAKLYRKRFARKGLEASQQQLVDGLRRQGWAGLTLLEVGCGVGYLHQLMVKEGASRAVGVDLSSKMLHEAREQARVQGLSARTDYREGDFVELSDSIAPADVVILDKVICCYPDADSLVRRSADKAARSYAFTIPRDRWSVRLVFWCAGRMLALIRCGFRTHVHDVDAIERRLSHAGFERVFQASTFIWLTRVYARRAVGAVC